MILWVKVFFFIALIQTICWFFAVRFRTDKLTDLAYGGTFLVLVCWLYWGVSIQSFLHTVLWIMISLRAVRLAAYLFLRVLALWKDKRFDGIREQKRSFLKFWALQTTVIFIMLIPTVLVMELSEIIIAWYTRIGMLLTVWWLFLETIADRQKFSRKQQYPTRPCIHGVWSKVQYPNYLGEILFWVGMYIICFASLSEWWRMVSLVSPFTICWLLVFVTWIPPLVTIHQKQRGTEKERQEYTQQTPKLIPYIW
jgi:steroid 5-alpha reductase family enzyme